MNTFVKTALAALALGATIAAPAAAQDRSQLAAAAGIRAADAAGMSTAQLAAHLHNRGKSPSEQVPIPRDVPSVTVSTRSADIFARNIGLSSREAAGRSFEELAAIHHNRGKSPSEQVPVGHPVSGGPNDHSQLAAAAGLSPEQAAGLTLDQISTIFHNRNRSPSEQNPVRR